MATEQKNDELNFDDLESDTLLNSDNILDNEELNDLDDFGNLQELDLDTDFDLGLDETEETPSEEESEATTFDEAEQEQDSSENEEAPATEDVFDMEQNLDSPNEDADESLSDDDLDLSLEANFDEQEQNDSQEPEEAPITADISEEDVANFDDAQLDENQNDQEIDFDLDQLQDQAFDEVVTNDEDLSDNTLTYDSDVEYQDDVEDDEDDDDDDDYGVDLKIGPVTIEFTQVIEPEEAEVGLSDDAQDMELESELPVEQEQDDEIPEQEEVCDINNDDELEFEVTQDDSLNNIDIDNVLNNQQDESLLNISISKPNKVTIDEETNNFLSDEVEDSDPMLGLVDSEGGLNEESTQDEVVSEDEITLPEGNDLDDVANVEENFVSDDDLNALGIESENDSTETESDEEETEAVLAEDIIIDEEAEEDIDDEKIALDGNEDFGVDLDAQEVEQPTEQQDSIEYEKIDDNTTAMTDEAELPAVEATEGNNLDEDICADVNIDEEVDETDEEESESLEITDELPESSEIVMSELDNANYGITEENNVVNVDVDDISAPNLADSDDDDETIGVSNEELDDILTSTDLADAPVEQEEELTEAEREELVAMPEDPSFENDENVLSDEQLAASVTIDGEPIQDNDILNNGDLDNYEDVPLPECLPDENAESENSETETFADKTDEEFNLDENDDDESIGVSEEVMSEITSQIEEAQAEESDEICKSEKLKQDVKGVLTYLDKLLDSLPEEKIKEFAESKEFEIYRKLFEELDIKH